MSKQKLDRRGWQRLITAYEASAATQADFAKRRGVSVSALQHWLYRFRHERGTTKASVQFVEVEHSATAQRCSRVEVELPSGMIIKDITWHQRDDREWLGLPARQYEKEDGSTGYANQVDFVDKETYWNFVDQVLMALKAHLAIDEGAPIVSDNGQQVEDNELPF